LDRLLESPENVEKSEVSETRPVVGKEASATAEAVGGAAPVDRPDIAFWISTVGVGLGPWAPGTWGALVAVLLFVAGLHRLGLPLYVLFVLIVTGVGVWASDAVESYFGKHDDGRIVIDEVAGQLITLLPIVPLHGLALSPLPLPPALAVGPLRDGIDVFWLLVVTGFVAFRWFDIRKPGAVKWAEDRFEGGKGVMADDVVAGLLGAVVVTLLAYVFVVSRLQELVRDSGLLAWLEPSLATGLASWISGWVGVCVESGLS
jgi:phosphatidylglycerophosphatase A